MTLTTPFPADKVPLLWQWMHENPSANFDDAGPKSVEELAEQVASRQASGESLWIVSDRQGPVGAVGFDFERSMIRGVCFTRRVHGTGIARRALAWVLGMAFEGGSEWVSAAYFADNGPIRGLLLKFGAEDIAEMDSIVTRAGKLNRWRVVRITRDAFRENFGHFDHPQRNGSPEAVLESA